MNDFGVYWCYSMLPHLIPFHCQTSCWGTVISPFSTPQLIDIGMLLAWDYYEYKFYEQLRALFVLLCIFSFPGSLLGVGMLVWTLILFSFLEALLSYFPSWLHHII